jgi:hypothetical protein
MTTNLTTPHQNTLNMKKNAVPLLANSARYLILQQFQHIKVAPLLKGKSTNSIQNYLHTTLRFHLEGDFPPQRRK